MNQLCVQCVYHMMWALVIYSPIQIFCKPMKANQADQSGQSSMAYSQDQTGNYQFAYEISEKSGASNFRQETRNGKIVRGSYGLTDVDGRTRLVNYQADKNGFVVAIDTNEPGTSREDAANTIFNGQDKSKGWAYAVAVQEAASKGKKGYKMSEYSAQMSGTTHDGDHERYSPVLVNDNDETQHSQVEFTPSIPIRSKLNTMPKHKIDAINEETVLETSSISPVASTINEHDGEIKSQDVIGPEVNNNSESSDPQSNSDTYNKNKDLPQYSDNDKNTNDEETSNGDAENVTEADQTYRKREFRNVKLSKPMSNYSETINKLATNGFKPSSNVFASKNKFKSSKRNFERSPTIPSSVINAHRNQFSTFKKSLLPMANPTQNMFFWK